MTPVSRSQVCSSDVLHTSRPNYVFNYQLNRSISAFIAQNRARNNVSNRNEFLGKRRRILDETAPEASSSLEIELPTCARTDAVPVNRDVQMKYDVAKNEDGPLRRTMKDVQPDKNARNNPDTGKGKGKGKASASGDGDMPTTLQRHPGLGERFVNLEGHLAVRYGECEVIRHYSSMVTVIFIFILFYWFRCNLVPSPPESLLDRIRFLEDHIVRLERDYPPWAALHFNQPNRGVRFNSKCFHPSVLISPFLHSGHHLLVRHLS
jgi:hypothetical protein